MKNIIALVFTLLIFTAAFTQDFSFIPYRKGDLWGYSDPAKKIKIKPIYERTYLFAENGLARVKKDGKYGFINTSGKMVIKPQFDSALDFFFEGALVEVNGKKYCLDKKGTLTETTGDGKMACSGFDELGDDNVDSWCSNCCNPFEKSGKYGMICAGSRDTIPAIYDTIYTNIGYDPDFMPLAAKKDGKYGMINGHNEIVFPFEYDSIEVIDYDLFFLKKGNDWSMNSVSKVLFSGFQNWDSYLFDSGDYIKIQTNGKWRVVNKEGVLVIDTPLDDIIFPSRMIISREFTLKDHGKYGFISDRVQIGFIYDKIEPFDGYDYTVVTKDGKEGYISLDGTEYFE